MVFETDHARLFGVLKCTAVAKPAAKNASSQRRNSTARQSSVGARMTAGPATSASAASGSSSARVPVEPAARRSGNDEITADLSLGPLHPMKDADKAGFATSERTGTLFDSGILGGARCLSRSKDSDDDAARALLGGAKRLTTRQNRGRATWIASLCSCHFG